MLVYILSTYEEHGAENITATTNWAKVPNLVLGYSKEICIDVHTIADNLRTNPAPVVPGSINLTPGWGGLRLDAVELT